MTVLNTKESLIKNLAYLFIIQQDFLKYYHSNEIFAKSVLRFIKNNNKQIIVAGELANFYPDYYFIFQYCNELRISTEKINSLLKKLLIDENFIKTPNQYLLNSKLINIEEFNILEQIRKVSNIYKHNDIATNNYKILTYKNTYVFNPDYLALLQQIYLNVFTKLLNIKKEEWNTIYNNVKKIIENSN